jgi:hypothetical protein
MLSKNIYFKSKPNKKVLWASCPQIKPQPPLLAGLCVLTALIICRPEKFTLPLGCRQHFGARRTGKRADHRPVVKLIGLPCYLGKHQKGVSGRFGSRLPPPLKGGWQ